MNAFSMFLWRSAFKLFYDWPYNLKIIGRENFPKEGPVIVASNHLSNNDPPIIGYSLPRHINFMAKEELFKNPIMSFIIRWLGAFPVKRGTVDKIAIRHSNRLLQAGKVLGIFPEGTRQRPGKLGRFHDGVASLALRTGVPVVPVALVGTAELKRNGVACIIGKPMEVVKTRPTKETIEEFNNKLRTEMEDLINNYQGEQREN